MSLYLTTIDELCDFLPSLPTTVHTSCLAISVHIIILVDHAVVVLVSPSNVRVWLLVTFE